MARSFRSAPGVTLTTTAAEGWIFAGWKGACTGVSKTCRAVLDAPKTAIATFVEAGTGYPLAVTTVGRGSVRSRPAGIACGATCASSFLAGSTIMLEALPQKGSKFVRWSGACTGSKPLCPVGVDGPKSVAATFAKLADQIAPKVKALPELRSAWPDRAAPVPGDREERPQPGVGHDLRRRQASGDGARAARRRRDRRPLLLPSVASAARRPSWRHAALLREGRRSDREPRRPELRVASNPLREST